MFKRERERKEATNMDMQYVTKTAGKARERRIRTEERLEKD